ncbi:hypothetical protein J2S74_003096 [Evansella vedderi]|uniref:DUF2203 domain-containing protein n=1 Tax=Evansella vedderi TaxID=38282 RepID=A0ABT9ZXZ1_9BACI|nr:DUF2203 domain-containing protein [Evansella vedderi]MDQ0255714.1 hypothetical protein [Evansella vedderi]
MDKKYFSIKEANELLPTLEKEILSLQELQWEFKNILVQLKKIKEINVTTEQKEDNIFRLESKLEFLELQGKLHIKNIENYGVQLKSIEMGLLDFPAILDGEEVLLCWKQGEDEITFYHGKREGFAGRRPLP